MRKIILSIIFSLAAEILLAQDHIPQLMSPTPVSANAASLGKFGEVPVNMGSGVPSISVPLYQITAGNLEFPISLSYHAGGIKVEEAASWVGLGWTLEAGGAIIRSCNGLPDEVGPGFKNLGYKVRQYGSMNSSDQLDYMRDVYDRTIDARPDVYYYNFGPYSGKFFFNNDGEIVTVPLSALKITFTETPAHLWTIVTPDGSKYKFSEAETTTTTVVGADQGTPLEIETAWYIKEATDIRGNSIQFFYDEDNYGFKTQGQEGVGLFVDPVTGTVQSYSGPAFPSYLWNDFQGKSLRKITFVNGEIDFYPSSIRLDIGDFILDKIEIKNSDEVIKAFTLQTSYYNPGSTTDKRLRLDGLTEYAGSSAGATYSFQYNSDALPPRMSFSQDHWGYYNGASNTSMLGFTMNGITTGADKAPNPAYTKQGTIEKITYPTGGSTSFEFENNTARAWQPGHYVTGAFFANLSANNYNNFVDTDLWFEEPFTVASGDVDADQLAHFKLNMGQAVGENPFERTYFISYFIFDNSNNMIYSGLIEQDSAAVALPVGSYKLKIHISLDEAGVPEIVANLFLRKAVYLPGDYVAETSGGLRIKKITTQAYPTAVPEVKFFKYNLFNQSVTSGTRGRLPTYTYPITIYLPTGVLAWAYNMYAGIFASSNSTYPLATSGGSNTAYKNITVELGTNGVHGKTEYTYSDFDDGPDGYIEAFPFPPPTSREIRRGLPQLTTQYRKTTTGFEKVSEEEYEYFFSRNLTNDNVTVETDGIAVGKFIPYGPFWPQWGASWWDGVHWYYYLTESEFVHLKTKKTRIYSTANPTAYLEEVVQYEHNYTNHFLPTKITSSNSKGEAISTQKKYPFEMQSTGTPNVYNEMVSRHILSPVVEESKYKAGTQFISSNKTNYDHTLNGSWVSSTPGSMILPRTIETKSYTNAAQVRSRVQSYDTRGNITSASAENGLEKITIWGYNKTVPVAEITGITYANAMSVLNQAVLDNPSSDAALRSEIQLVRTNYPGAHVTSYTYKPLVGVTSKTETDGNTEFYEYDGFGRLYLIRDSNNRIIKKICYNYSGQTENCQ